MVRQNTILTAFSDLPDPRKPRNQAYKLPDLIAVAILATFCGADDWVAVSLWAESNLQWLQGNGICMTGVPSHDTLARFFRYVDSIEFEKRFIKWTQLVAKDLRGTIAIDGKTLRNSGDRQREGKAVHIVSAFAAEHQLVLGQLATDAKSNEITAIPQLLAMLDIRDATITIDAAGCQRDIAKEVRNGGGDYVLALKGNQGTLHAEVENFFSQAISEIPEETGCDYAVSEERSRGRLERRETWATEAIEWLPQRDAWFDLTSIVCVRSTRTIKGQTTTELRYYISSLDAEARGLAQAVRAHWGVENKLHWQLDVSYGEDSCKVRKDNGAENFSVLRRCTLNVLKKDVTTKAGIRNKRARAGWNRKYLLELLQKC